MNLSYDDILEDARAVYVPGSVSLVAAFPDGSVVRIYANGYHDRFIAEDVRGYLGDAPFSQNGLNNLKRRVTDYFNTCRTHRTAWRVEVNNETEAA